ncbi:hypothetical protein QQX98_010520 [Neonectria punicea]|uniref:Uncharacterized protein n=1 Tax=Neonectria punicea TaxID=979145 RepID=A0ABR1GPB8_9HYPO
MPPPTNFLGPFIEALVPLLGLFIEALAPLLDLFIEALVPLLACLLDPTNTEDAYAKAHTNNTMDPTSPLGQLCSAHRLVSDLHAAAPEVVPTLFQMLNLNHREHPFFPHGDCAYPLSKNHREARDLIMVAWLTISANNNGLTTEWRDAVLVVAATLRNVKAWEVYMGEMLPKFRPSSDTWWRKTALPTPVPSKSSTIKLTMWPFWSASPSAGLFFWSASLSARLALWSASVSSRLSLWNASLSARLLSLYPLVNLLAFATALLLASFLLHAAFIKVSPVTVNSMSIPGRRRRYPRPSTQAQLDAQIMADRLAAAARHPSSGFSVLRFQVDLPGTNSQQPVEICFHDSFQPRPANPLSLHLDDDSLAMIHPAPALVAPGPPGVIVDCGRVELFEPNSINDAPDSINDHLDSIDSAPDSTARGRSSPASTQSASSSWTVITIAGLLLSLVFPVLIWSSYHHQEALPTRVVQPHKLVQNFTTRAIYLPVSLLYAADKVIDTPSGSLARDSPNMGSHRMCVPTNISNLILFAKLDMIQKVSNRERVLAFELGEERRYFMADYMTFALGNWTLQDVADTWLTASGHEMHLTRLWAEVGMDYSGAWLNQHWYAVLGLQRRLRNIQIESPGKDDMYFLPLNSSENAQPSNITRKAPRRMSLAADEVILAYRNFLSRLKAFPSSCSFFDRCRDVNEAPPGYSSVHPACWVIANGADSEGYSYTHGDERVALLFDHFEHWIEQVGAHINSTRARYPNFWVDDESVWPDDPPAGGILKLAEDLVGMLFLANRMVEMAKVAGTYEPEKDDGDDRGKDTWSSFWAKVMRTLTGRGEQKEEFPPPAAWRIQEAIDTHLVPQIRIVLSVVLDFSRTCHELQKLRGTIEMLSTPQGWTATDADGEGRVALRIPHPMDQAKNLMSYSQWLEYCSKQLFRARRLWWGLEGRCSGRVFDQHWEETGQRWERGLF